MSTKLRTFVDGLVGGHPPGASGPVLAALVATAGAAAHLPGWLPAAFGALVVLVVLAALWAERARGVAWACLGGAALLPVPFTTQGAGSTAVAVAGALVTTGLVRALAGQVSAAHQTALRSHGARTDLERVARAERDELAGLVHFWSTHDQLTQLLDRSALSSHLQGLGEHRLPAGVLVISLAGFAGINEALGSTVGDELLTALGQRLRGRARETDLVARLGGDEFAVLLPGLAQENASALAERLLTVLEDPFTVGPNLVPLHARCGLAVDDGSYVRGPSELLHQAASAARTAQVGRVPQAFSASTQAEALRALELERDLHRALENDELFVLYQPLVSSETGRIESVEALVRWQHPERGLIPPDDFISAAERSGQVVGLGMRVLGLALAQLRAWTDGPAPAPTVAVNVSARQLVEPGFVHQVQSILWSAGVDPRNVILELTESMVVEDGDSAIDVLWQLRGLGVRLAIDDFGTGYSSLARLGQLPIDEMKIDKSFVDKLGDATHDSTTLVTAAIAMGHGLGLSVVAEGVETRAQADQLSALGCDLLQGYLLGRPQTATDLTPQLSLRLLTERGQIPVPRDAGIEQPTAVPRLIPDVARAARR
jgi:diguanylate cyclase (GGDEF)-like protein